MKASLNPLQVVPCKKTNPSSKDAIVSQQEPLPAWEVRNSIIHGRGLFAARDITEGERVIEYLGEKITKAESNRRGLARMEQAKIDGGGSVYIFELNKRYDIDGDVDWNPAKYCNHSCEPNCEVQNIRGHLWQIALRDIDAGEELTYDYGYDIEHFLDHPCLCGKEKCIGYIVRADQRKQLKKLLRKNKRKSES